MKKLFLTVAFIGTIALMPADTHAISNNYDSSTDSLLDSPLDDNKIKLNSLDNEFDIKQEQIDIKLKNVDKVKTEAEKLEDQKKDIKNEVERLKDEVAELKRLVAEKKRREAAAKLSNTPVPINGYVAGNGYDWGQCTWYVKTKRPDIGNYWGNADMWLYSAQADGFAVGSEPRPGAIGQENGQMHVVYVESVNGDMVNISEMNYAGGLGVVHTRTVHKSAFTYIYGKA